MEAQTVSYFPPCKKFEKRKRVNICNNHTNYPGQRKMDYSTFKCFKSLYCDDFLNSKYSLVPVSNGVPCFNGESYVTTRPCVQSVRCEINNQIVKSSSLLSSNGSQIKSNLSSMIPQDKNLDSGISSNEEDVNNNENGKESNKGRDSKKNKAIKKEKIDYNSCINFLLIPNSEWENCISLGKKEIGKSIEVVYNNDYPRIKEKRAGTTILSLFIKNLLKADPGLNLIKYEQLNMSMNKNENGKIKYGDKINTKSIEIEGKEKINIELNTNQGDNSYITKIAFLKDQEEKLVIYINLKSTRSKRGEKQRRRKELIEILREKIKEKKNSFNTLCEIFDINKEGLNEYLKNILLEFKKVEEINETIIKRFLECENVEKSIENICDYIFNKISKIEEKDQLGLLILCFEYIYKCIIDKINNTSGRDEGITGYLYDDWKDFITEFQLGINSKNDLIIFTTNKKRKMDHENENYINADYSRKKHKNGWQQNNSIQQINNNSDFEMLIS